MSKKIQVCMGSACHLKGAPLIAQAFQVELEKRQKPAMCYLSLPAPSVRANASTVLLFVSMMKCISM